MPSHFSQQHLDPSHEPEARPRFPVSAAMWIPLSLMFGAGMLFAAKFGHERATAELERRANPAAANETMSAPFLFDPGDEPIVLAAEQKALRDHLSAPPGSEGSGTVIVSEPIRVRLVTRELDLVRLLVVDGPLGGQRFWAKGNRLLAQKDASKTP